MNTTVRLLCVLALCACNGHDPSTDDATDGGRDDTVETDASDAEPDTDAATDRPDTDLVQDSDTDIRPDTDLVQDRDTDIRPDTDLVQDSDTDIRPDTDLPADTGPDTDSPGDTDAADTAPPTADTSGPTADTAPPTADTSVPPPSLRLMASGDNILELYLNGRLVGTRSDWSNPLSVDIPLPAGSEHVLAAHVRDQDATGGFMAWFEYDGIVAATGSHPWKATSSLPPGWWQTPGYDDSTWGEAETCASQNPWGDFSLESAEWIWHDASCSSGGEAWFRTTVIAGPPVDVALSMTGDNILNAYIDGVLAMSSNDWTALNAHVERLSPGTHTIAVEVLNLGGPAGFNGSIQAAGVALAATGDGSWKVSDQSAPGWDQPGYDDSAWGTAARCVDTSAWNNTSATGAEWVWTTPDCRVPVSPSAWFRAEIEVR